MKNDFTWKQWWESAFGLFVQTTEAFELNNILKKIPGKFLLQIDGPSFLFNQTKFPNRFWLNSSQIQKKREAPVGDATALPFLPYSVDTIAGVHYLENTQDPEKILQESHASLIDGGHLIIVGFNPFGLLNIKEYLFGKKFWKQKKFWSRSRIKHSLQSLGFTFLWSNTFFFYRLGKNPPGKFQKYFEKLGPSVTPGLGNLYVIVAQKRPPAGVLHTPRWVYPPIIETQQVPQPTSVANTRRDEKNCLSLL